MNLPREPRGLMWTNASVDAYDGRIVPARDPMDREVYWFTVTPLEAAEKRTDRWAVEQHWISMTPLELDVTDRADLDRLRAADPLDDAAADAIVAGGVVAARRRSVRADEAHTAAAPGLPDVEGRHRTAEPPPTSAAGYPQVGGPCERGSCVNTGAAPAKWERVLHRPILVPAVYDSASPQEDSPCHTSRILCRQRDPSHLRHTVAFGRTSRRRCR